MDVVMDSLFAIINYSASCLAEILHQTQSGVAKLQSGGYAIA